MRSLEGRIDERTRQGLDYFCNAIGPWKTCCTRYLAGVDRQRDLLEETPAGMTHAKDPAIHSLGSHNEHLTHRRT
jgi:hypothetical protein